MHPPTTPKELEPYQERVAACTVRPGDFLDEVEPNTGLRGPRGGRYRYDGQRVESRVERVVWLHGGTTAVHEVEADGSAWAPAKAAGFRIYTRGGKVTLPGNLAQLTTAVVRRAATEAA